MDLAIFWLLLLLSFKLPSCVFTLTINLDRVSLETPIWIMPKADKAGDRMRISKNRSGPNYSYLSDSIQPFINWNGVLKMVNNNIMYYFIMRLKFKSPDYLSITSYRTYGT